MNGLQSCDWSVGVQVVQTMDLSETMGDKVCLVLDRFAFGVSFDSPDPFAAYDSSVLGAGP